MAGEMEKNILAVCQDSRPAARETSVSLMWNG